MRTITRHGKNIVIHKNKQSCIHLYLKARSHGWCVLWTGGGMIYLKRGLV